MKTLKKVLLGCFLLLALIPFSTANAYELELPSNNYYLYGDFQSYSLPILAWGYDQIYGGGTGPGNPYYVASTPGIIKDYIVIGTGSSGKPVTTNFAGMDDAYATPNNDGTFVYSTDTATDPGQTPTLLNDYAYSWDSNLQAFTDFLGAGNDPIFFFNNNDENSNGGLNQTLLAWGQLILSGDGVAPVYFDLTNYGSFEGDPTTYSNASATAGLGKTGQWDPTTGSIFEGGDYVISGGQVCINSDALPVNCDGTSLGNGVVVDTINHNLGADQAAYAIISPELNEWLQQWLAGGHDGYETLSVRFMFEDIDNGYEQIFIASNKGITPVPEPSTIVLLLAGVCGLFVYQRRSKRNP